MSKLQLRSLWKSPLCLYVLVAVVILLPLLKRGYVLTLDMVFTPHIAVPASSAPTYPLYGVLHLLNTFIPADILQKILLVTIITLTGWGMHRLVATEKPASTSINWDVICTFAGLLYIFNPFTYSRFMAGQYLVLLGYALLPFFIRVTSDFLKKPGVFRAAHMAVWLALIGAVSVHTVGFAVLLAFCLTTAAVIAHIRDKIWLLGVLRGLVSALGLTLLLSSYWILPFFFGHSASADMVRSFTDSDRLAFATAGEGWGRIWNIVTLQGFWADNRSLYMTAREVYGTWWIWFMVLFGLVGIGLVSQWRAHKVAVITGGLAFLLSVGAACGSDATIFAPINRWITDILPVYAGYREPQKFVAIIALVYAYFAAFGLGTLWQMAVQSKKNIQQHQVKAAAVLLPILLSPLMLWGFHGQLAARQYPADWFAMNQRLQDVRGKVLFLPWHQYMRFDFAGRVIANPGDAFFDAHLISSSDPELRGLTNWPQSSAQQAIGGRILPQAASGSQTMGVQLQKYDIQYVLLAKEYDYKKYDYLDKQADLHVVKDTAHLRLYEVRTTIDGAEN